MYNFYVFFLITYHYKNQGIILKERKWKINVFQKYILVVHHFGLSKFGFVLENSGSFWIEYNVSCPDINNNKLLSNNKSRQIFHSKNMGFLSKKVLFHQ